MVLVFEIVLLVLSPCSACKIWGIMRKVSMLCCFLCVFGAAFILLYCVGKEMISDGAGSIETESVMTRKLMDAQESGSDTSLDENGSEDGMTIEDYRPIDPVPSSKAVRHGPVQHSTPLLPYIPVKPSPPPSQSKHEGAPQPG
ncbi:hypothetical protein Droror1_Dr00010211 [Drosera rotundifolia]